MTLTRNVQASNLVFIYLCKNAVIFKRGREVGWIINQVLLVWLLTNTGTTLITPLSKVSHVYKLLLVCKNVFNVDKFK